MAPLKTEINLKRLLVQCERMASKSQDNDGIIEWRLEKYVEALQAQYAELGKMKGRPDEDTMLELKKKVEFLHTVVKTGKKKSDGVMASGPKLHLLGSLPSHHQQIMPSAGAYKKEAEIGLQTKGRYARDLKAELLGDGSTMEAGVRNRRSAAGGAGVSSTSDNIEDIMKHHHQAQEKVAEEMIRMAQNLKHNSMAASTIIKKDTAVLGNTSKLADANFDGLKTETSRLEEHNRRYCSWWIWLLLATVLAIYLVMILFIVFVPKRTMT